MSLGIRHFPSFDHHSLFIHEDRGANHAHKRLAIHLSLSVGIVRCGHGVVFITKQVKVETKFRNEVLVTFRAIGRDTPHHRVLCIKLSFQVAEPATFFCSARGIVFRIKPNQNPLSFLGAQTLGGSVLIGQREFGCRGPFDNGHDALLHSGKNV